MPDIAIPIVFPDYLIAVNTPKTTIKVPDLLPGIDILPEEVSVPETNNKFPELGHAGILFINGRSGTTKYYEYGRYNGPSGMVRKLTLRDVKTSLKGHPTKDTLSYVLSQISSQSGQNGRILGAYIEVPGKYQAMLDYAEKRKQDNANSGRQKYDILLNSCNHFMKRVLEAAGVDVPYMFDPRPNSYIAEIRGLFPKLDYTKVGHKLVVENPPDSLASAVRVTAQPASA